MRILKMMCCLCFLAAAHPRSRAQGFFNQTGEMLKKSGEQLVLLKTYSGLVRDGYGIIKDGVGLAYNIKNGEFGLHGLYYKGLENVNPKIRSYPFLPQTTDLYNKMVSSHTDVYGRAKGSGLFTDGELKYLDGVYTNLLAAAVADMKDIERLTGDGQLKMTDDERIKRLDGTHKKMLDKFKVMTGLNNRVLLVMNGRKAQKENAAQIKKLYGQ